MGAELVDEAHFLRGVAKGEQLFAEDLHTLRGPSASAISLYSSTGTQ